MIGATAFSDRSIRLSVIACIVGFGGFLVWGAVAPLDEGVSASGQIVVETNRKQIQHLEGGIISALHVKEGDTVAEGDILLELAPLQSETARDELAQEFALWNANITRLTALKAAEDSVDFASLSDIQIDPVIREEIIARQTALFGEQQASHEAELSVLESRLSALQSRRRDVTEEIKATSRALETARKDLALRQELLEEKLEIIGNVSQAEREVISLEAEMSRLTGERNQATKNAEAARNEIRQAKARFQQTIGEQMIEAQAQALSTRERLAALDDRLARTVVKAPQGGKVLNMAYSTVGGVVGSGEVIMEIVPVTEDLIVKVRLSPNDRDAVKPGQTVKAQLTAYKSFKVERLDGVVLGVSADVKQEEQSGASYYEAQVRLDASQIDANSDLKIVPGMPVETFIASGNRRTFFDYVFEPILTVVRRGTQMS